MWSLNLLWVGSFGMSMQRPSMSYFQPWYTQRRPQFPSRDSRLSLRPKYSDARRCAQCSSSAPSRPSASRHTTSRSPISVTRTGGHCGSATSSASRAGTQNLRRSWPMGVPDPVLVSNSLSAALSIAFLLRVGPTGRWVGLAAGLGEGGDDPRRGGVEDLHFVLPGQEAEAVNHRHEVVAGAPGLRPDRVARAGRLAAEHHPLHASLLDRRLKEVQVIAAGVVEQVVAQVPLRDVMVGRNEPVKRAAAVADDHPELGIPVEYVPVGQELAGQVLLGDESQLVVVRHHAEPRVK